MNSGTRRATLLGMAFVVSLAQTASGQEVQSGVTIRVFELAIAVAKSYCDQFPNDTYGDIYDRVAAATNELNRIFRRDCNIGFNLAFFEIYDPRFNTPDYFAGCSTVENYRTRNQLVLDNAFGAPYPAYYEIGHCIFRNSGQPSQGTLRSLGMPGTKANAASNIGTDPAAFDRFFHEVGHQCGAEHSFASFLYPDASQRHANSAVEIGGGITLMSYAGQCGTDNYRMYDDPNPPVVEDRQQRFHAFSVGLGASSGSPPSIWNHVRTLFGVGTTENNSEATVPTVNFTTPRQIPKGTPFTLTATVSPESSVTYWEQMDVDTSSQGSYNIATSTTCALFRAYEGGGPTRVVPKFEELLKNRTQFEVLPQVERTLHFRCTASNFDDNQLFPGIGYKDLVINVVGEPFKVTAPVANAWWRKGCEYTVTWQVGGGSTAANVKILMTTDAGANWTTLNASTPNDGSQEVTIPDVETQTARIKVEPTNGDIFFSVNPGNFHTVASPDGTFLISPPAAHGGVTRTGHIFFEDMVPSGGGFSYTITSSDPSVTVPSTKAIGVSVTSATFDITTASVTSQKDVTISLSRGPITETNPAIASAIVTLYPASPVKQLLTGNVTLGDYGGGPQLADVVPIIVEVVGTDSHGTRIGTAYLDEDGDFKVLVSPSVPAGSYDVYIKPDHWLRKHAGSITFTTAGATGVTATCVNGDCDQDNSVGIGDYSIISGAYLTRPTDCDWNRYADLDGSLEIDIGDFAILSGNIGIEGD